MLVQNEFEQIVERHYAALYRFALSLSGSEADAGDLTQQVFWLWASKGDQLRDRSKVKSWLFTALHREFLNAQRRRVRFPHKELEEADGELPEVPPMVTEGYNAAEVFAALAQVDEPYRGALSLFYLEDYAYHEAAEILQVPVGTMKSRVSRGIAQLQNLLREPEAGGTRRKVGPK